MAARKKVTTRPPAGSKRQAAALAKTGAANSGTSRTRLQNVSGTQSSGVNKTSNAGAGRQLKAALTRSGVNKMSGRRQNQHVLMATKPGKSAHVSMPTKPPKKTLAVVSRSTSEDGLDTTVRGQANNVTQFSGFVTEWTEATKFGKGVQNSRRSNSQGAPNVNERQNSENSPGVEDSHKQGIANIKQETSTESLMTETESDDQSVDPMDTDEKVSLTSDIGGVSERSEPPGVGVKRPKLKPKYTDLDCSLPAEGEDLLHYENTYSTDTNESSRFFNVTLEKLKIPSGANTGSFKLDLSKGTVVTRRHECDIPCEPGVSDSDSGLDNGGIGEESLHSTKHHRSQINEEDDPVTLGDLEKSVHNCSFKLLLERRLADGSEAAALSLQTVALVRGLIDPKALPTGCIWAPKPTGRPTMQTSKPTSNVSVITDENITVVTDDEKGEVRPSVCEDVVKRLKSANPCEGVNTVKDVDNPTRIVTADVHQDCISESFQVSGAGEEERSRTLVSKEEEKAEEDGLSDRDTSESQEVSDREENVLDKTMYNIEVMDAISTQEEEADGESVSSVNGSSDVEEGVSQLKETDETVEVKSLLLHQTSETSEKDEDMGVLLQHPSNGFMEKPQGLCVQSSVNIADRGMPDTLDGVSRDQKDDITSESEESEGIADSSVQTDVDIYNNEVKNVIDQVSSNQKGELISDVIADKTKPSIESVQSVNDKETSKVVLSQAVSKLGGEAISEETTVSTEVSSGESVRNMEEDRTQGVLHGSGVGEEELVPTETQDGAKMEPVSTADTGNMETQVNQVCFPEEAIPEKDVHPVTGSEQGMDHLSLPPSVNVENKVGLNQVSSDSDLVPVEAHHVTTPTAEHLVNNEPTTLQSSQKDYHSAMDSESDKRSSTETKSLPDKAYVNSITNKLKTPDNQISDTKVTGEISAPHISMVTVMGDNLADNCKKVTILQDGATTKSEPTESNGVHISVVTVCEEQTAERQTVKLALDSVETGSGEPHHSEEGIDGVEQVCAEGVDDGPIDLSLSLKLEETEEEAGGQEITTECPIAMDTSVHPPSVTETDQPNEKSVDLALPKAERQEVFVDRKLVPSSSQHASTPMHPTPPPLVSPRTSSRRRRAKARTCPCCVGDTDLHSPYAFSHDDSFEEEKKTKRKRVRKVKRGEEEQKAGLKAEPRAELKAEPRRLTGRSKVEATHGKGVAAHTNIAENGTRPSDAPPRVDRKPVAASPSLGKPAATLAPMTSAGTLITSEIALLTGEAVQAGIPYLQKAQAVVARTRVLSDTTATKSKHSARKTISTGKQDSLLRHMISDSKHRHLDSNILGNRPPAGVQSVMCNRPAPQELPYYKSDSSGFQTKPSDANFNFLDQQVVDARHRDPLCVDTSGKTGSGNGVGLGSPSEGRGLQSPEPTSPTHPGGDRPKQGKARTKADILARLKWKKTARKSMSDEGLSPSSSGSPRRSPSGVSEGVRPRRPVYGPVLSLSELTQIASLTQPRVCLRDVFTEASSRVDGANRKYVEAAKGRWRESMGQRLFTGSVTESEVSTSHAAKVFLYSPNQRQALAYDERYILRARENSSSESEGGCVGEEEESVTLTRSSEGKVGTEDGMASIQPSEDQVGRKDGLTFIQPSEDHSSVEKDGMTSLQSREHVSQDGTSKHGITGMKEDDLNNDNKNNEVERNIDKIQGRTSDVAPEGAEGEVCRSDEEAEIPSDLEPDASDGEPDYEEWMRVSMLDSTQEDGALYMEEHRAEQSEVTGQVKVLHLQAGGLSEEVSSQQESEAEIDLEKMAADRKQKQRVASGGEEGDRQSETVRGSQVPQHPAVCGLREAGPDPGDADQTPLDNSMASLSDSEVPCREQGAGETQAISGLVGGVGRVGSPVEGAHMHTGWLHVHSAPSTTQASQDTHTRYVPVYEEISDAEDTQSSPVPEPVDLSLKPSSHSDNTLRTQAETSQVVGETGEMREEKMDDPMARRGEGGNDARRVPDNTGRSGETAGIVGSDGDVSAENKGDKEHSTETMRTISTLESKSDTHDKMDVIDEKVEKSTSECDTTGKTELDEQTTKTDGVSETAENKSDTAESIEPRTSENKQSEEQSETTRGSLSKATESLKPNDQTESVNYTEINTRRETLNEENTKCTVETQGSAQLGDGRVDNMESISDAALDTKSIVDSVSTECKDDTMDNGKSAGDKANENDVTSRTSKSRTKTSTVLKVPQVSRRNLRKVVKKDYSLLGTVGRESPINLKSHRSGEKEGEVTMKPVKGTEVTNKVANEQTSLASQAGGHGQETGSEKSGEKERKLGVKTTEKSKDIDKKQSKPKQLESEGRTKGNKKTSIKASGKGQEKGQKFSVGNKVKTQSRVTGTEKFGVKEGNFCVKVTERGQDFSSKGSFRNQVETADQKTESDKSEEKEAMFCVQVSDKGQDFTKKTISENQTKGEGQEAGSEGLVCINVGAAVQVYQYDTVESSDMDQTMSESFDSTLEDSDSEAVKRVKYSVFNTPVLKSLAVNSGQVKHPNSLSKVEVPNSLSHVEGPGSSNQVEVPGSQSQLAAEEASPQQSTEDKSHESDEFGLIDPFDPNILTITATQPQPSVQPCPSYDPAIALSTDGTVDYIFAESSDSEDEGSDFDLFASSRSSVELESPVQECAHPTVGQTGVMSQRKADGFHRNTVINSSSDEEILQCAMFSQQEEVVVISDDDDSSDEEVLSGLLTPKREPEDGGGWPADDWGSEGDEDLATIDLDNLDWKPDFECKVVVSDVLRDNRLSPATAMYATKAKGGSDKSGEQQREVKATGRKLDPSAEAVVSKKGGSSDSQESGDESTQEVVGAWSGKPVGEARAGLKRGHTESFNAETQEYSQPEPARLARERLSHDQREPISVEEDCEMTQEFCQDLFDNDMDESVICIDSPTVTPPNLKQGKVEDIRIASKPLTSGNDEVPQKRLKLMCHRMSENFETLSSDSNDESILTGRPVKGKPVKGKPVKGKPVTGKPQGSQFNFSKAVFLLKRLPDERNVDLVPSGQKVAMESDTDSSDGSDILCDLLNISDPAPDAISDNHSNLQPDVKGSDHSGKMGFGEKGSFNECPQKTGLLDKKESEDRLVNPGGARKGGKNRRQMGSDKVFNKTLAITTKSSQQASTSDSDETGPMFSQIDRLSGIFSKPIHTGTQSTQESSDFEVLSKRRASEQKKRKRSEKVSVYTVSSSDSEGDDILGLLKTETKPKQCTKHSQKLRDMFSEFDADTMSFDEDCGQPDSPARQSLLTGKSMSSTARQKALSSGTHPDHDSDLIMKRVLSVGANQGRKSREQASPDDVFAEHLEEVGAVSQHVSLPVSPPDKQVDEIGSPLAGEKQQARVLPHPDTDSALIMKELFSQSRKTGQSPLPVVKAQEVCIKDEPFANWSAGIKQEKVEQELSLPLFGIDDPHPGTGDAGRLGDMRSEITGDEDNVQQVCHSTPKGAGARHDFEVLTQSLGKCRLKLKKRESVGGVEEGEGRRRAGRRGSCLPEEYDEGDTDLYGGDIDSQRFSDQGEQADHRSDPGDLSDPEGQGSVGSFKQVPIVEREEADETSISVWQKPRKSKTVSDGIHEIANKNDLRDTVTSVLSGSLGRVDETIAVSEKIGVNQTEVESIDEGRDSANKGIAVSGRSGLDQAVSVEEAKVQGEYVREESAAEEVLLVREGMDNANLWNKVTYSHSKNLRTEGKNLQTKETPRYVIPEEMDILENVQNISLVSAGLVTVVQKPTKSPEAVYHSEKGPETHVCSEIKSCQFYPKKDSCEKSSKKTGSHSIQLTEPRWLGEKKGIKYLKTGSTAQEVKQSDKQSSSGRTKQKEGRSKDSKVKDKRRDKSDNTKHKEKVDKKNHKDSKTSESGKKSTSSKKSGEKHSSSSSKSREVDLEKRKTNISKSSEKKAQDASKRKCGGADGAEWHSKKRRVTESVNTDKKSTSSRVRGTSCKSTSHNSSKKKRVSGSPTKQGSSLLPKSGRLSPMSRMIRKARLAAVSRQNNKDMKEAQDVTQLPTPATVAAAVPTRTRTALDYLDTDEILHASQSADLTTTRRRRGEDVACSQMFQDIPSANFGLFNSPKQWKQTNRDTVTKNLGDNVFKQPEEFPFKQPEPVAIDTSTPQKTDCDHGNKDVAVDPPIPAKSSTELPEVREELKSNRLPPSRNAWTLKENKSQSSGVGNRPKEIGGIQTRTFVRPKPLWPRPQVPAMPKPVPAVPDLVAASLGSLPAADVSVKTHQKVSDFLWRVLQWNARWLEEHARVGQAPPVVDKNKVWPLLETYDSYDDYVKIMMPLMLMELWESIYKSWSEKRGSGRSRIFKMIPLPANHTDKRKRLVDCGFQGVVIKGEEGRTPAPSEGDLVVIHLPIAPRRPHQPAEIKPVFGHVTSVRRGFLRPGQFLHDLLKPRDTRQRLIVVEASVKLLYRDIKVASDTLIKVETIDSIVSQMRQCAALLFLPRSPLASDILRPHRPQVFHQRHRPGGGVPTQSTFNESQSLAIQSVSEAVGAAYTEPRICLLQGPPGTGKTSTILGIIRRIISNHVPTQSSPKASVLLCAPSNGGIDELTRRLVIERKKAAERNSKDNRPLNIVRVGNPSTIHPDVQSYSLGELVKRNYTMYLQEKLKQSMSSVHSALNDLNTKISRVQTQISELKAQGRNQQVERLERELGQLMKKKDRLDAGASSDKPMSNADEHRIRREILTNSDVVCCTLNGSGSNTLLDTFGCLAAVNDGNNKMAAKSPFTCVIIDEATQTTEVDSLIPLQYGASKLVLVGDPEQLPATVLSKDASDQNFNQSLFERLYAFLKHSPLNPVLMLQTQYRMHPEICSFPSEHVYYGMLHTDNTVAKRRSGVPLKHQLLFDVKFSQEVQGPATRGATYNDKEAEVTACLCEEIRGHRKTSTLQIGVITPYQMQKRKISEQLRKRHLEKCVEVGTVDGYQGREKDVVILSCVRAKSNTGSIGFLADRRRMNVALTRAKYALYVIAHLSSLKVDGDWKSLILHAEKERQIVEINSEQETRERLKVCHRDR